jgi:hypothetical protein
VVCPRAFADTRGAESRLEAFGRNRVDQPGGRARAVRESTSNLGFSSTTSTSASLGERASCRHTASTTLSGTPYDGSALAHVREISKRAKWTIEALMRGWFRPRSVVSAHPSHDPSGIGEPAGVASIREFA